MRWIKRVPVAVLTAVALTGLAQPADALDSHTPPPRGTAPHEQFDANADGGTGARTPFVEQQAEDARTNGTVLGPDWAYGTLAAEAVGRRAVQLDRPGQYVEFTLTKAANAVNVRYSVPDSADGKGIDATLGAYVDGRFAKSLAVSSRYSWYYGQYPWTNNPADGGRRQLYDDTRLMFDHTLPAGSTVRLQIGKGDAAPSYVIDTADFEHVDAPKSAPPQALSVTSFGADPSGRTDSSDAFQHAVDAARGTGRTVWIPPGTFTVTRHLLVDRVTLRGSGPWYSVLHGAGVGVYGDHAPNAGSDVHLADFAIFGEVAERNDSDQVNGIGGALAHSTVDNVWIQHTKVGAWLDGPFDDLRLSRLRILDVTADGVNFHDGVTHSSVTDSYVRGTGDDGLAMWSDQHPDSGDVFAHNTVKSPALANNIALYGGSDNTVTGNLVTDTLVQGGGIHVGNRFGSVPLAGTTTVAHNTLQRTGTLDLFSHIGEGALWFWAADAPLTGNVDVENNLIQDSAYEAVQVLGSSVDGVHFAHNTVNRAGTFAFQLNSPGSATARSLTATGLGAGGRYDCGSGFTFTEGPGDHGWSDVHCGYPAPGPLQISGLGRTLSFETDRVGGTSDPQTVLVTNPGPRPARIASVGVTGVYTLANTCPGVLAPGATCAVDVRFVPTARGDRNGSLTISDGTSAGRYQVHVTGRVVASTVGNLAAGRPVTASGAHDGFPAANAVDSDTSTYWESPALTSPQSLTVDLGAPVTVARVSLRLNSGWGGRTQSLEVLASDDGENFTTVAAPADRLFDPTDNDNTVDVAIPPAPYRYLRVQGTTNSGAPGLQLAELEVYAG